jgi:aspartate 1-decarboxylase
MLKSKIHRARVTETLLDYEGSLKLDRGLMEAANIVPFEMVKVYNISNGERFDTYVVPGKRDSGTVGLMGAAARKGVVGDLIIIATYVLVDETQVEGYTPIIVHVDDKNRVSITSTA